MLSSKKTSRYLFYAYLILLTWCILFKFETRLEFLGFFSSPRVINWLPFAEPMIVNGNIVWAEMAFNHLFFIPFGVCIPLVREGWSPWKIIGAGFSLSFLYELLQFILAIGMADVTDLIFNTLGVVLGLLVYHLFLKITKTQTRKWVNTIGLIFVGLPLIVLILLVIVGL